MARQSRGSFQSLRPSDPSPTCFEPPACSEGSTWRAPITCQTSSSTSATDPASAVGVCKSVSADEAFAKPSNGRFPQADSGSILRSQGAIVSSAAPPLEVAVRRGGVIESRHHVHAAIATADGGVVATHGRADRPTFARSAVKAIQALALVETGAADHFGFGPEALALACSSHSGTPLHAATAAAMLAALGLDETALACGAHWPLHDASARDLARSAAAP
ncbi:MAG: asparaginase, partial [Planctomycetes bacterium]|nr:asparaginase [Planctomycetota bacterium]